MENIFELIFLIEVPSILELLNKIGHIPLPYLKERMSYLIGRHYQTVFASTPGEIAAPTAHFYILNKVVIQLKAKDKSAYITLHVRYGTFQPIRSRFEDHRIHNEHVLRCQKQFVNK